ncbi:MAG: WD40/YVTN/BNR-like repeat-containing protein, partial [Candidatus Thorarchaeota archaeon]
MIHGLRRKAIYLILCISLCITLFPVGRTTAQTQNGSIWEILDHEFVHTDAFPRDVEFFNATHGWVASQNESSLGDGIILHTYDAGDSWQLQLANESQLYRSIEILDENTLWITCRGGLVYSQDTGSTWNMTYLGGPNDPFYGIHFINQTHGWVGSNPYLYKTTDAGQSWQQVASWTFSDWARDIHFVTASDGWIIGFYGIYHTTDGGDSWEKSFNYGGWSMSFVNENEAWAVSDNMLAHMV